MGEQPEPANSPPNTVLLKTTDIVSAYVRNNNVSVSQLPVFIENVAEAVERMARDLGQKAPTRSDKPLQPAVPKKKSVTHDAIYCLECGKRLSSLKRHLMAHHNLTPEEYRSKWKLPDDYPMVSPRYASVRSDLAKQNKLGNSRRKSK